MNSPEPDARHADRILRRARALRLARALVALALLSGTASAQSLDDVVVGHWVRVKGHLVERDVFRADELELRDPSDEEELLGTVTEAASDGDEFVLLGQRVTVSARTEFSGVQAAGLLGRRVNVEGHYRDASRFSSREIEARDPGRDRVEGRVDALRRLPDGGAELRIMRFRVVVPADVEVSCDVPVQELALAPERAEARVLRARDDDEVDPDAIRLGESLSFGGQLEWKTEWRDDFDLDDADRQDERRSRASIRGELLWEPDDDFFALVGARLENTVNRQEGDPADRDLDGELNEMYGYWRDAFGTTVDLQVGRQDFDEPREWLYDENLDALRAYWDWNGGRFELSASTVLADGDREERETRNLIAYLSNGDWDRHLALYVIDRSDDEGEHDKPLFAGARALGEWLPDQDVWLEVAAVRGYDETEDYHGWGYDVGTTWRPGGSPWYGSAGYAFGSGDDSPGDGDDDAFRQTGLHDNNGKLGGVTSFKYYGELVEPELSNMGILTLGVGRRISERTSLDLVWHRFRQDVASTELLDTNLDEDPSGTSRDLGQELDLVLGIRAWSHWDVEVILAGFDPGDAFPGGDTAWLGALQLRYRF